jgi:hypothetical protein
MRRADEGQCTHRALPRWCVSTASPTPRAQFAVWEAHRHQCGDCLRRARQDRGSDMRLEQRMKMLGIQRSAAIPHEQQTDEHPKSKVFTCAFRHF